MIRGFAGSGDVVSVQVTYHPGWQARAAGKAVPIAKDGLGLMVLRPACEAACEIDMEYDGGLDMRLLRAVSPVGLVLMAGWEFARKRLRSGPGNCR